MESIPETIAHRSDKSGIRVVSVSFRFFYLLIQFLQNQVHICVFVQLQVEILSDWV